MVNLPPLEFKPALMIETFSLNAVVMEKSMSTPQNSTNALSFHDLNRRHYNTFHCDFTISCQSISQHVDMALVRLIHQFSTMIDDIKATQTDIKLNRYTAGSASPTPTFKARGHRDFRSSDFSRSSRGSLNGANRVSTQKKRAAGVAMDTLGRKEPRSRSSLGRSERRTSRVSRKGSRDVADHMTIQMDDSDSITVSEQSEPSAECWQNMYKLLNFYSLISDPTGILEKGSPENCLTGTALPPGLMGVASQLGDYVYGLTAGDYGEGFTARDYGSGLIGWGLCVGPYWQGGLFIFLLSVCSFVCLSVCLPACVCACARV